MMRKGRFTKPAAEIARRYSESVSFDWRLYRYDIAGSIAHAAALPGAEALRVASGSGGDEFAGTSFAMWSRRARHSYAITSYRHRTVKIALLLVTLPARLLTVKAKSAPLSPTVVGGVVYDALVAPVMFTPFFVH
jgi:hypothetical protein